LAHGATVPSMSMWGREYYFKKYDTAKFLLERGMSASHMTWHRVTLLHDMAHAGEVRKAALLLDHGADLNAINDEYQSTPLGFAARWGKAEMVTFLLGRGADPSAAGAPWAAPLAWARTRGHAAIAEQLLRAGAR